MLFKQVEQQRGVAGIVLRAAGMEGFAVFGQRRRVYWKQVHFRIAHQRIHNGTNLLLQAHGDSPARMTGQLIENPLVYTLGAVFEHLGVRLARGGILAAQRVLLISPIQADHQCIW